MSAKVVDRKNKIYWINSAIVIFLYFGFGIVPNMFGLTDAGMRAVGIFLGLLYGWIFVEFGWVSLLGLMAMGTTGAMTIAEAIQTSFMSQTFLLILFPMILMAYLSKSGFSEWVAYKMLAIKCIKGHPWMLVTMVFLAASVLGFLVTVFPMVFLMWSIFMGIADVLGLEAKSKFVGYMLCGIVMMQTVSSSSVPWNFLVITMHSMMKDYLGDMAFPFMQVLILGIIGQLLTLVVYLLIGKFIVRVDVSKMTELPESFYEKAKKVKLSFEGKVGLATIAIFILCVSIPSLFPNLPISPFLAGAGVHGVSILLLGALLVVRNKDGKPVTTTTDLVSSGVNWEIIFLAVSTFSLAALLKVPEVGILEKVNEVLIPIVGGLPPSVFIIAATFLFWAVTQVTHNYVIILTMVGALSGVCAQIGINPWLFAWIFMNAMNMAYCTPAASAPAALFFGHSWVAKKDAYVFGILFSVINVIAFLLIMTPIAKLFFGSI